jgi:hypothetical protein
LDLLALEDHKDHKATLARNLTALLDSLDHRVQEDHKDLSAIKVPEVHRA